MFFCFCFECDYFWINLLRVPRQPAEEGLRVGSQWYLPLLWPGQCVDRVTIGVTQSPAPLLAPSPTTLSIFTFFCSQALQWDLTRIRDIHQTFILVLEPCGPYWPQLEIPSFQDPFHATQYCIGIKINVSNTSFFEKTKRYVVTIVALFYIFPDFFNVWLNRRQMDSHICLCFQDIMRYCLDYVKKMPHTGMSAWNFIGYGEDFVFYSECNGKPLMGFKQRNVLIGF